MPALDCYSHFILETVTFMHLPFNIVAYSLDSNSNTNYFLFCGLFEVWCIQNRQTTVQIMHMDCIQVQEMF